MSIGENWPDMGRRSPIPTKEDRARMAEDRGRGLPDVRHDIRMRYERVLGIWRVTFADAGKAVWECSWEHDHTLEGIIERGRGFTCLADRQAVELGMRQGLGMVMLHLDAEQYAAINQPR